MFTLIKMLVLVVSHSPICIEACGKEFTAHHFILTVKKPIWCLNRFASVADGLHMTLWGTWVKNTSAYVQSMEQKSLLKKSKYWWTKAQNGGWDSFGVRDLGSDLLPLQMDYTWHLEAHEWKTLQHIYKVWNKEFTQKIQVLVSKSSKYWLRLF